MFESLVARGAKLARRRAAARRERLAARLRERAPRGVEIGEEGERVTLAGRGLERRFAMDARLRWLVTEARDER
jgi:hypothetical protein